MVLGRKHKTVPRDETTQKLKDKIRRLESDKRKLISELKTLQEAFDKSREFINKKVADISVEDLTRLSDKSLKQIEDILTCKNCGSNEHTYILLPNNRKVRMCLECRLRENINDSIGFNCIEEVI
jgi:hypothetical protein